MGLFLALTALPVEDVDAIADAIVRYAGKHNVSTSMITAEEARQVIAAAVYAPRNGWSVVIWPTRFTGLPAVSRWLSQELDVPASAVSVYDGDLWMHVAFRRGEDADQFASVPDYFTADRREGAKLSRQWSGNPVALAELFAVSVDVVTPYLAHPFSGGLVGLLNLLAPRRKAFPDDEFELTDVWVFVDLWRRFGIAYPEVGTDPVRCIRLPDPHGFPTGGPTL
jgi:hypothetical protein